ncbi:MAG: SIS domain-containing protein [Candidatus Edwardsbacteria bacterium]
MNLLLEVEKQLLESAKVKERLAEESAHKIVEITEAIIQALQRGRKILLCGNGGSAAEAQHIAGELVVRLSKFERQALPAIALTTDSSIITAEGNDHSFETVFSRQIEALGYPGDLLIALSTSGNSLNIITAIEKAKEKKLVTVGFTGGGGGRLSEICDFALCVPANEVTRIQEGHTVIGHIICELIEEELFEKQKEET